MSNNIAAQPSTQSKIAGVWKKHERKILITTTVISTVIAVGSRTGIAQHNAFLKEKGLFNEFYDLATDATS